MCLEKLAVSSNTELLKAIDQMKAERDEARQALRDKLWAVPPLIVEQLTQLYPWLNDDHHDQRP